MKHSFRQLLVPLCLGTLLACSCAQIAPSRPIVAKEAPFIARSANLVRNSGFEELDADGFPVGWRSHQNAAPAVFRSSVDEAYAGQRSCQYFNETAGYYEFIEQVGT